MPMSKNEEMFLAKYDLTAFDRPSLTTDAVLFTYDRHFSKKVFLLLIKRGGFPYKDYWALPGGFYQLNESLEQCCVRELKEETGATIDEKTLISLSPKSEPGRDPRGAIITCPFVAFENDIENLNINASDDASDARLFEVTVVKNQRENKHLLRIINDEENLLITIDLNEKTEIGVEKQLAFDHDEIISEAILQIQTDLFSLNGQHYAMLPKQFKKKDLATIVETFSGEKLAAKTMYRYLQSLIEEVQLKENIDEFGKKLGTAKLYEKLKIMKK